MPDHGIAPDIRGDHQTHNARFLVDQNAGWLMPQGEMTPQRLATFITTTDRPALLQRALAAKNMQQLRATDAMVAAFAANEKFALVIAPEGTRGAIEKWRSGFYHIALGAGVPIVPAWVDNKTMRGGIGPALMPSGDYRADLAKLAAFYRSVMPDHPRVLAIEDGAGNA